MVSMDNPVLVVIDKYGSQGLGDVITFEIFSLGFPILGRVQRYTLEAN